MRKHISAPVVGFLITLLLLGMVVRGAMQAPLNTASAASGSWISQTTAATPADNPLKGFMPWQGTYSNFPHSMEYFIIPLKDMMTAATTYSWSTLESKLNDIASRGHQAVIRPYLDWPNTAYG